MNEEEILRDMIHQCARANVAIKAAAEKAKRNGIEFNAGHVQSAIDDVVWLLYGRLRDLGVDANEDERDAITDERPPHPLGLFRR